MDPFLPVFVFPVEIVDMDSLLYSNSPSTCLGYLTSHIGMDTLSLQVQLGHWNGQGPGYVPVLS